MGLCFHAKTVIERFVIHRDISFKTGFSYFRICRDEYLTGKLFSKVTDMLGRTQLQRNWTDWRHGAPKFCNLAKASEWLIEHIRGIIEHLQKIACLPPQVHLRRIFDADAEKVYQSTSQRIDLA